VNAYLFQIHNLQIYLFLLVKPFQLRGPHIVSKIFQFHKKLSMSFRVLLIIHDLLGSELFVKGEGRLGVLQITQNNLFDSELHKHTWA